jgi:hypothetical protein
LAHAGIIEASMKHSSSRELFDYWNERRGQRPAPDRGDIEPGAIRGVLADAFILGLDSPAGHRFRIAGTRVCAAFGRELKGVAFLDIWAADSVPLVRDLLTVVTEETVGIVAGASATAGENPSCALELLLLPLVHRGRTDARVLGALVPTPTPYWLGTSPLHRLSLGALRYLGLGTAGRVPSAALKVPPGRLRRGFMVIDGGQG